MFAPYKKRVVFLTLGALASVAGCVLPHQAVALSFEQGDWLFNVDTTLTGAAQWRTESRKDSLTSDINGDDGNNNFDKGLVSAKGSFILELGGQYEDFSFFVRTDGLYDYVYEDKKTDLSPEQYVTYNGAIPNGGNVKRGDFPDDTLDEHGKRLRLLEAFFNYRFDLGNQSGAVRFGRQVIAWGEALLYTGVNGMQNPVDGGVALSPGVEAKEIFLPTTALDLKWSFTDNLSAEAYYKLEWEKTTTPGVGSFLSPSDVIGPGAQRLILIPDPVNPITGSVADENEASDEGQWGAIMRYLTDGGTSLSLSYTNSHANKPGALTVVDLANMDNTFTREEYAEDVEFWQFGVNTTWGEASVYADVAYSDNAYFVDTTRYVNDRGQLVVSDMVEGEYWQVVVGMLDLYTALPWLSEQITLTAEMIYQANDMGKGSLEDSPFGVTDDAWGYNILVQLKYFAVLPGLDIEVPMSFKHDVDGYGASVMNSQVDGQKWASLGAHAYYLDNWEFDAKYSFYFGNDNPGEGFYADRDNIALSVKYKF